MFAYCLNQPIMYLDADGKSCDKFKQFLQDAYESGKDCVNAVGTLAKEVFGFKQSIVSTTATQQMGVAEPEPSILCPIVYATGANTTTTLASSGNASKPIVLCTQTEYGSPQKTSISLKLTLGDTVVAFGIGSGTYSASFSRAEGGTTSTTSVGYSPLGKTMLSISQSFTRPVSSQTNATQYNKLKVGWWTIAWGYAFVKSGGKVPISGFSPAIS